MHYEITAQHFQPLIEHLSLSVDAIADVAGGAADNAVATLVSDSKLLCCGIGLDAPAASLLSALLRTGIARERPSLPVVDLSLASAEPLEGASNWLCQQIAALGQQGDMAFIFASQLPQSALENVQSALTKRAVKAVWVGAQGDGPSLTFPGASALINLSLSHASACCLAELIDITLFGPLEDAP